MKSESFRLMDYVILREERNSPLSLADAHTGHLLVYETIVKGYAHGLSKSNNEKSD